MEKQEAAERGLSALRLLIDAFFKDRIDAFVDGEGRVFFVVFVFLILFLFIYLGVVFLDKFCALNGFVDIIECEFAEEPVKISFAFVLIDAFETLAVGAVEYGAVLMTAR